MWTPVVDGCQGLETNRSAANGINIGLRLQTNALSAGELNLYVKSTGNVTHHPTLRTCFTRGMSALQVKPKGGLGINHRARKSDTEVDKVKLYTVHDHPLYGG